MEGKGPLQRDQALSETFLLLSYKAPPPWHTGALGEVGKAENLNPGAYADLLHLFLPGAQSHTLAHSTRFIDLVIFC